MKVIPLDQCEEGVVYRIHSRNLSLGVFVAATKGFIGIREKFGSRFLDTEYHYDTGPPHGTARPLEVIGRVPTRISLEERWHSYDQHTGRPVAFDKPVRGGGKGWYFTDTGESNQGIRSVSPQNQDLFDYLEAQGRTAS